MVHDASETLTPGPPRPLMRVQGDYFLLSIGHSLGLADRRAGFAFAYITPALMAFPDVVNSCFVESLGIHLACGRQRVPLHAAAVRWAQRGVLLTGRDGAGKSTLACACLLGGFQLLAEDMVYAPQTQVHEDPTVWGDSRSLHLLQDALKFFPQLSSLPIVRQMSGESKLRLRTSDVCSGQALTQMPIWGICLIARGAGTLTRLVPADPAEVARSLTYFKGDPPVDKRNQLLAADRLLQGKTVRIECGSDLTQAVAVLKRWIEAS